jgi:cyclophilin family peptidyl-prolyl cis-trans isomerase
MIAEAVRQWAQPPLMAIDVTRRYVATIKTVKGDIVVELAAWEAPITVNNFVFLARQRFYDGCTFHRVGAAIVQGGDPTGTGTGGPGYTIPDECRNLIPLDEGVVAMANMGEPHSSGSQFFITRATRRQLDGGYNVFGRVIRCMDVVKQIRLRDALASETPLPPGDEIVSVRIEELPPSLPSAATR